MGKALLLATILISTWVTLNLADDLTWDLTSDDPNIYSNLLQNISGQAKSTTCFGMSKLGPPSKPPQHIIIRLLAKDSNEVRVGVDKSSLYVVGYYEKAQRFFYFKNASTNAFSGAKLVNLNYTGSYADVEKNAGKSRETLGVSKTILNSCINDINGKDFGKNPSLKKRQAQFLLVVIQMISEAVRFNYIADVVKKHYTDQRYTDAKLVHVVNKWDKISTAITNADANGMFRQATTFVDLNGKDYTVTKVKDVEGEMGMLKYDSTKCKSSLLSSLTQMHAQAKIRG